MKKRNKGFTLVELLVVIGIIALLISILLPALSKARSAASTMKCLANLHAVGQSLSNYVTDYKGSLFPAFYTDPTSGYPELVNWPLILFNGKYLPQQSKAGGTGSFNQPNTVLMCPDSGTLRCSTYSPPSPQSGIGAEFWRLNQFGSNVCDTTYGINATYDVAQYTELPFNMYPMANASNSGATLYNLHKITEIRNSGDMVMFFDGLWLLNFNMNRVNARHNNQTKTNILFADGHASSYLTKGLPGDIYNLSNLYANSAKVHWRLDQN